MNDFILIFRNDFNPDVKFSPEEMQGMMKLWQDWVGGIAAQNKLADPGNRLGSEGRTLKPNNVVTDGPYAEIKEMISGYIMVKADNLDEAFKLAERCPILNMGGNVEVRDVIKMNM
jgi:hypothetical protein